MRQTWTKAIAVAIAVSGGLAGTATAASAANNPGTGDTGYYDFPLRSPDGSVQVNVGSGNLLVATGDLADADPTYHVTVQRYYNSLATAEDGILGPRWRFQVDPKTRISDEGATVNIDGPTGYRIRATRSASGTYTLPQDFNGELARTTNGWTLTRTNEGDVFSFDNSGTLTGVKDVQDRQFTVQATSAGGRTVLSSFGDQNGRRANFSYNGDSRVRQFDDPASGHHTYGYTSGRLSTYSAPGGAQTRYGYDANGFLNRVEQPSGDIVATINDAGGRVTSFSVQRPNLPPSTTTFDYSVPGQTTVTNPDGSAQTYTYDDDYRTTNEVYGPDDLVDPNFDEDGYGDDAGEDYCPAGAEPEDCNSDVLGNPTTAALLADGGTEVDDDDDLPAFARAAASRSKISSNLLKGGKGWGIADNNADDDPAVAGATGLFDGGFDAELSDLNVKRVRYAIPWNAVLVKNLEANETLDVQVVSRRGGLTSGKVSYTKSERNFLKADRYIKAAEARGIEVHLTIDRAGDAPAVAPGTGNVSSRHILPSEAQYKDAVVSIHRQWPDVKHIGSWNEMNGFFEPLRSQPTRAGRFWKILNRYCNSATKPCTAVAGDFVDILSGNSSKGLLNPKDYISTFRKATSTTAKTRPAIWGLHGYESAQASDKYELKRIKAFATATACAKCDYTPQIWLTEQGGIFNQHPATAAEDGKFMVSAERKATPRIKRFYYYQLQGDQYFDAGLRDWSTQARRPLYNDVRGYLRQPTPPTPPAP